MKLRQDVAFSEPSRNLFRFTTRESQRSSAAPPAPVADAGVPDAPQGPPPFFVRLSGVASDRVGESEQRTAILSTPTGVVLARVGDEVGGLFKVSAIGEDTVDLIRLTDGWTLHLNAR